MIHVALSTWGGKRLGDGSYQFAPNYGTAQAFYIENCHFERTTPAKRGMVDSEEGGQYVFRYNRLIGTGVVTHGTEGDGKGDKACRKYEVYGNICTGVGKHFVSVRGGSGVVFDNTLTNYASVWQANYFRKEFGPIANGANGVNAIDDNYPGGPFESGTHMGAIGATQLVDNTKTWTTDQWRGYSVHDTTKGTAAMILKNTSNTLTKIAFKQTNGAKMTFDTGDAYEIYRVRAGIDMPGMGQYQIPFVRPTWPKQAIEPVYIWNNTINGKPNNTTAAADTPCLVPGTHYIAGTAKPGYTPFVYPHPLVSGAPPPATPTASPPTPTVTATSTATTTPTPTATAMPTATPDADRDADGNAHPATFAHSRTYGNTSAAKSDSGTCTPTPTATPIGPAPAAPGNLSACVIRGKDVELSWRDNSADETAFELVRTEQVNGQCVNYPAGLMLLRNTTRHRDTGTEKKKSYCFRCRAVGQGGTK